MSASPVPSVSNTGPLLSRLSLICLGMMVCLPFIQPIHRHPIPSFYEEWLAVFLGALAFMFFLLSRPRHLRLPDLLWLPGILIIATLLQLAAGLINIPMLGMFQTGFLLWAALMMILAATLRQQLGQEQFMRTLALAILVGALISALAVIGQRVALALPGWLLMPAHGRVYGNLGQPNLLTTYLWSGCLCVLYFRESQQLRLSYAIAGLLILSTALGFTASRMAWLDGLVLIALAAWYRPAKLSITCWHQRLTLLSLSLSMIIAVSQLARWLPWLPPAQMNAFDRLRAGLVGGDARLLIWRDTWTMILDHPWLGNGVGNYAYNNISASARAPAGLETLAGCEHAHNFWLQIAADFGLPLALLLTLLAARWLWRTLNGITQAAGSSHELQIAMLTLIFIHSQLEYPLWHGEFLGLAALLLGAASTRSRILQLPRLFILQTASLILLLALCTLAADYRRLEQALIIQADMLGNRADWQRRIQVFLDLSLHSPLAPYARGTLAVTMKLNQQQAGQQSMICDAAMKLWISPELMARCAVLRRMTGHPEAAYQLLGLAQQAFRSAKDQTAIRQVWEYDGQPKGVPFTTGSSKSSGLD